MGATIFIGYPEKGSLHITLNRQASNALETLLDESLQKVYPELHEKIMEVLVLDQISFTELTQKEFNIVIKAVRDCIINKKVPTEYDAYQKKIWEKIIEPLIQQDERYQSD
ncbi:hypothetical protein BGI40_01940 [Snodgrassella communis]|uniref:Uncharacterized protein n=2 Tax=Snodgrassella TaxID=1193515 RepID=A0A2N9WM66_9NEIS|nr:hypothetical protein [Snodgrassella communis]PIT08777.1 hypothetical protein BGI29_05750 [Snodgrassella communis]PIT27405.1 hypothetical protein BGI38_05875 [Snodgrassella communis]PIT30273.1 hypothetical protein BGI39_01150 [Snodgrassella communis]PIT31506.1 hypothetical protein BGI40_09340 [Snodgrassella communis]PIT36225.1 hypothetical protein BGI40_01975 [Snodgrassella communis]